MERDNGKRVRFLVAVLCCLSMAVPVSSQQARGTSGVILYVGGSGPGNYSNITDAVLDAAAGDTVFVYNDSSPYYEKNIVIDKSIRLIGEDKETTVIDGMGGGGSSDVLYIYGTNGVRVSGFTIRNCSLNEFDSGIHIQKSSNVNISNNTFINTRTGIVQALTFHSIISGNTIMSVGTPGYTNRTAIGIDSFLTLSTIRGNTILYPAFEGIYTQGCHCLIEGNIIANATHPGGLNISQGIDQAFSSNRIVGNTITKFVDGIAIWVGGFNLISGNNISHCRNGINLLSALSTSITANSISECNQTGILFVGSFLASVTKNNFFKNGMDAYFMDTIGSRWARNYWDSWDGSGPMIIHGKRWINFDWHPAKNPY